MGVGGTFDGRRRIGQARPRWMQKSGLEWLFRLIQDREGCGDVTWSRIWPFWLILRNGGTAAIMMTGHSFPLAFGSVSQEWHG